MSRYEKLLRDHEQRGLMLIELAQVVTSCLVFTDILSFDVSGAVSRKLQKHGEKYLAARLSQRH